MPEKREPGLQQEDRIEQEHLYQMNLLTNRDVVIAALIEMERRDWFERHQPGWGENSIDGALKMAQSQGSGVIYGFGGFHRYIVRSNGDVYYSSRHGPREVDQAKQLGFKLN